MYCFGPRPTFAEKTNRHAIQLQLSFNPVVCCGIQRDGPATIVTSRPRYAKGAVQYSTLDAAEGGYRTSAFRKGTDRSLHATHFGIEECQFTVNLRDFRCNSALFGLFPQK